MSRQQLASMVAVASILSIVAGCAPRVRVTANPQTDAQGIRYYRPKPYLKVVPAEIQIAKDASQIEPGLVKITLEYLPDFSEEYAIDVRPGLGIADVSIKLEDGWNLTQINQKLDSQTDDHISAAGDLIKAVSGLVPTAAEATGVPDIEFTVPATDVPLGYYESVIGRAPDGRKQLYGFRYLGFLPYQPCPTVMGGVELACCGDPAVTLYGLTFAGGRMVFKPLPLMAADPIRPAGVSQTAAGAAGGEPESAERFDEVASGQAADDFAAQLAIELLGEVQQSYPEVRHLSAHWARHDEAQVLRVSVRTPDGAPTEAIRRLVRGRLGEIAEGKFAYDVEIE